MSDGRSPTFEVGPYRVQTVLRGTQSYAVEVLERTNDHWSLIRGPFMFVQLEDALDMVVGIAVRLRAEVAELADGAEPDMILGHVEIRAHPK